MAGRNHNRARRRENDAIYTVYYKPPPDPRARRRRRNLLRISCTLCLGSFAAAPIAFAVLRAQSECSIDVHCVSANQWLLRRRRDGASIKRKNDTSILLIVAHPDDEVLWAGDFLLEYGKETHVMVTSTSTETMPDTTVRSEEFRLASDLLGFSGEFLWGLDQYPEGPLKLERSIRRRITSRVCGRPWDSVVTHGYDGEFGHPQHQAVHDAVLDAIHYCCNSTERLRVFQPDPFAGEAHSKEKARIIRETHKSQRDENLRMFDNWTENIVPYKEFDSDLAGRACRTYSRLGKKDTCRGEGGSDSSDLFLPQWHFKAKGWC